MFDFLVEALSNAIQAALKPDKPAHKPQKYQGGAVSAPKYQAPHIKPPKNLHREKPARMPRYEGPRIAPQAWKSYEPSPRPVSPQPILFPSADWSYGFLQPDGVRSPFGQTFSPLQIGDYLPVNKPTPYYGA